LTAGKSRQTLTSDAREKGSAKRLGQEGEIQRSFSCGKKTPRSTSAKRERLVCGQSYTAARCHFKSPNGLGSILEGGDGTVLARGVVFWGNYLGRAMGGPEREKSMPSWYVRNDKKLIVKKLDALSSMDASLGGEKCDAKD